MASTLHLRMLFVLLLVLIVASAAYLRGKTGRTETGVQQPEIADSLREVSEPPVQPTDEIGTTPIHSANDTSGSQIPIPKDQNEDWKLYTKTARGSGYQVEYPADWSWEEHRNATYFLPRGVISIQQHIALVFINSKETPPLPVQYSYTTIRAVQSVYGQILLRKREPSPVTERYVASIQKEDYVVELRFSLDRKYDEVFDRMLSTLKFTQ